MSAESGPPPVPSHKAKKQKPLLLIILAPVLIAALVMLVIDRQSRPAAEDANARLEVAQRERTLEPADVRKLLEREPAEESKSQSGHTIEKYTWRGGLKTYYVFAVYSPGEEPFLTTVTLNDEPPEFK